MVLVQGDTTTAFACALAAFYQQIPIAHIEAGLRSGRLDNPFPEEANRSLLARVADVHFAPTRLAASHLLAEGIAPDRIFVTGNTVIDNLLWELDQHRGRTAFEGSAPHRILVTLHRRENQAGAIAEIAGVLRDVVARGDVEVVLPMHLSPTVRAQLMPILGGSAGVRLIDPLGYEDFVRTLADSTLVVTDSGGVQEEAPSLGTPVLVVRETTERPEGIEAGTSHLIGTDPAVVYSEILARLDRPATTIVANPYGDGQAAGRIVDQLRDFHKRVSGHGGHPCLGTGGFTRERV
jgi:UDP-N-acetylglucosamine 2-epimerase (non-hydrolysing)